MRAGPVDISVLIQHAASGEIVDGSAIAVEMAQADAMSTPLWSLATAEAATNKLLRAANFELPNAGLWQVQIECKMDGEDAPWQTSFEMEVGPPKPAWAAIWPWVTWPFAAIALFAIHRMLVQRRRGRLILNTTSRRLSFP